MIGFSGEKVYPLGTVKLKVLINTWTPSKTEKICFFVRDKNIQSTYNMILDRVALKKFEAVLSIIHQCLKFSTCYGVDVVKGNQVEARECYYTSADQEELKKITTTYQIETLDPREEADLVKG